ncbi:MAG: flagellar basal body-associated FliL family protein [Lachnospiraceae bacterium]|nr:flagellar basal body-associated FliL family protein [Lachnospiraceae bacterium]
MKRNLLSIIVIALLVVNIVLSAIMMVSVSSASRKTAALVSDIATLVGLEIDGLPVSDVGTTNVTMADTAVYNITAEMTIPLKTGEDGQSHYAVGNVSLSLNTKHEDYKTYNEETLAASEGIIKDIIFSVLGNYTKEEALSSSEQIKAEMLERLREKFDSEVIYGVSYNFLYS